MDKIIIKGLELFAYHGVNPEEKAQGQTFLLDIALEADLSKARRSDSLQDTINYAAVRQTAVEVLLKKPEAPMNAVFDYVAVELRQERPGRRELKCRLC